MKRAVVLLSGGLDSATALAIAKEEGFVLYALSFHYGQRHSGEVACARQVAQSIGTAEHKVARIDLGWIGGSALTADLAVPKGRTEQQMSAGIPSTYVPARNTIFLSYAVAWAETLGANDIYIGVNAIDYSGYPDCRAAFISAFERAANLGTRATVEWNRRLVIHAPLIDQIYASCANCWRYAQRWHAEVTTALAGPPERYAYQLALEWDEAASDGAALGV